ncbi:hypothetical protein BLA9940_02107 [Burkholderia aenigmatica]|uniref:hypothetical protein n=1 Tax=Burkholderia aenigmatica TaxID=2015348 RepID=UPI0014549BC1|nr:hypothetical protein [Burkholderia aenigmatica]VWC53838.1 hypothetical protein BLA9940_02107 [Burkholderia aenigmatica]
MPNDNVLTEQIRAMCNAHVVTMGDDFALGADRLAKRILALLAAHPGQQESRAEVTDTQRLDWLRDETCDLRCVDVPTGGGDSDVRWVVVQHHMSKPHEREIGRSHSEDPREAIDAARTGEKQ